MKRCILTCVVLLVGVASWGQSPGPFYRQFFFNPYLFNPAYVGINGQPELNLAYRQQWTNFNDAPVTTGISLQVPTSERVMLGFNAYTDKQVLLRTSSFMGTFGYVVPIAAQQTLRFALSAGAGLNTLDLTAEEMNTNDPAIINAINNNYYVDGNFGVVYANKGLRLGFALTELFKSNPFNDDNFNEFKLSNLKNRLYSASYKFNVGIMENIAIEPYVLYRQTEDGLQDAWEAATILHFKNTLWAGASYHQDNGLALILGMNVLDKFRFSYSYEFPPFNSELTSMSSHELHMSLRFGKKQSKPITKNQVKRNEVAKAKALTEEEKLEDDNNDNNDNIDTVTDPPPSPKLENMQTIVPAKNEVAEPVLVKNETESIPETKNAVLVKNETESAPKIKEVEEEPVMNDPVKHTVVVTREEMVKKDTGKPAASFTLSKGFYVVVGAFGLIENSVKLTRQLYNKGYKVNVALNPKNNYYYVYIFSTFDIEEARKVRNQYRMKNLFKDAWVYTIE